jgi:tetratricopeptide (TPR) repeat protein
MVEKGKGFLFELRRRRVLRVAGTYLVVGWLVTEISGFLFQQAGAPGWTVRLLAIVFLVGFPVAVALAWIIQRRPDGKWSLDSLRGQGRTVLATVALGVLATAGLAWLILPRIEDAPTAADYQPIPNSIALLPLAGTVDSPGERVITETLLVALGSGLDQSDDLILLDLRRLSDRPADPVGFARRINAKVVLTGELQQATGGTRIRLELIDVGQRAVTWSDTFDWEPSRVGDNGFAVANDVLGAMGLPGLSRLRYAGTDNPEAYEAYVLGGQQAASRNIAKLARAMDSFQRAVELDPEYVLAYVGLAEAIVWYQALKQPGEAEWQALDNRARDALETAHEFDSESAAVITHLGVLSLRSGERELARRAFEKALELDPHHAKAYWGLAWAMLREGWDSVRSGDLEEAERLLRKALELDPLNAEWRSDLATLLFEDLGRGEEAFAEIHRSIALDPNLWSNYLQLGFWEYYNYGRADQALLHFRKAYALDPDYSHAAWWVASVYADLGAAKEALAWIERALEAGPGSSLTWFVAYQVYYTLGFPDEAKQCLLRSVELDPGSAFALHALGTWEIAQGSAEEALERWRLAFPLFAISENPAVDASNLRPLLYYADNLMEAGETSQAVSLLKHCLDVLDRWRRSNFVLESVALDFEQEIYAALELREEFLAAMRVAIVDRQAYWGNWMYAFPLCDFIRDDPEFQELMDILHENLARQYERIQEMERNGEMPPAPGVVLIDR